MALISFTPIQDGVTGVNASATNTPLSTIYNDYNGNITNANIASGAAIAQSKISLLSVGAASTKVTTSETRTSATYGALATAQAVTATIGSSGLALVTLRAQISNNTNSGGGYMTFVVSGANTQAASDTFAVSARFATAAGSWQMAGSSFLLTGLAAGSTTFTAQFKSLGTDTATFLDREIAVIPL